MIQAQFYMDFCNVIIKVRIHIVFCIIIETVIIGKQSRKEYLTGYSLRIRGCAQIAKQSVFILKETNEGSENQ